MPQSVPNLPPYTASPLCRSQTFAPIRPPEPPGQNWVRVHIKCLALPHENDKVNSYIY